MCRRKLHPISSTLICSAKLKLNFLWKNELYYICNSYLVPITSVEETEKAGGSSKCSLQLNKLLRTFLLLVTTIKFINNSLVEIHQCKISIWIHHTFYDLLICDGWWFLAVFPPSSVFRFPFSAFDRTKKCDLRFCVVTSLLRSFYD